MASDRGRWEPVPLAGAGPYQPGRSSLGGQGPPRSALRDLGDGRGTRPVDVIFIPPAQPRRPEYSGVGRSDNPGSVVADRSSPMQPGRPGL